jgi:glutathione S-transferase
MLTLHHAPMSRSSRCLWLLEELGADYQVHYVGIRRMDGSGGPDPANPHPMKQVPALEHDGAVIIETIAIMLHLTDLYPQAGMAPKVGDADRANYLSWLGLYSGVLEPAVTARFRGPEGVTPQMNEAYEALDARWKAALEAGPYLLGERFSAVDVLFGSLLQFFRQAMPPHAVYDEWVGRIAARPALARAQAKDAKPA